MKTMQHDFFSLLEFSYLYSYLLTFLIVSLITSLLFLKHNSLPQLCMKILASSYCNAAIYALPVISFVLGDPKAGIIGNLIQVIMIQSIFITILSLISKKESSINKRLLNSISNPLVLMPVIGLTLNYFNIRLPQIILLITQNLGNSASSITLFTFGLTLGGVVLDRLLFSREIVILVIIKNLPSILLK